MVKVLKMNDDWVYFYVGRSLFRTNLESSAIQYKSAGMWWATSGKIRIAQAQQALEITRSHHKPFIPERPRKR